MRKTESLVLAALLAGSATLLAAVSAQAQTPCPTTDKLSFAIPGVNPLLFENQPDPYRVVLGSAFSGSTSYIVALVTNLRTGVCSPSGASYDGVTPATRLKRPTNLCMGPKRDVLTIVTQSATYSCGGVSIAMNPFPYNGFSLQSYLGTEDDHFHGGAGADAVFGGPGNDDISDPPGLGGQIYGEDNGDELYCTGGSFTLCDGGGGNDYIEDSGNFNGHLVWGGRHEDEIHSCHPAKIDCGNFTDIAFTAAGTPTVSCEEVEIACF